MCIISQSHVLYDSQNRKLNNVKTHSNQNLKFNPPLDKRYPHKNKGPTGVYSSTFITIPRVNRNHIKFDTVCSEDLESNMGGFYRGIPLVQVRLNTQKILCAVD